MRTGRQCELLWISPRSSTSRRGGRLIPDPSAPAPNAASALSPARAIPSRGGAGFLAPTMRWNSSTRCRAGTAIGSARTRRGAAARRPRKRWCRWPDRRSAQEKARLRWLTVVPPGSPDGGGARCCSEMASPRGAAKALEKQRDAVSTLATGRNAKPWPPPGCPACGLTEADHRSRPLLRNAHNSRMPCGSVGRHSARFSWRSGDAPRNALGLNGPP